MRMKCTAEFIYYLFDIIGENEGMRLKMEELKSDPNFDQSFIDEVNKSEIEGIQYAGINVADLARFMNISQNIINRKKEQLYKLTGDKNIPDYLEFTFNGIEYKVHYTDWIIKFNNEFVVLNHNQVKKYFQI